MRANCLMVAALMLVPSAALANHDVFLGWSKDGTFYVKLEDSNDTKPLIDFCALAENPTWPPKLSQREHKNGCVYLTVDGNREVQVAQVKKLVEDPKPGSTTGPGGAKIVVRWVDANENEKEAVASITDGGKRLTFHTGWKLSRHGEQLPRTKITDYFWRADGKSVAFYIDTDPKDRNSERWLTVLDLKKNGSTR